MIQITTNVQHFPIRKSLVTVKIELTGTQEERDQAVLDIREYMDLIKTNINEAKK